MKLELRRVVGRKLAGIDLSVDSELCVVLGDAEDGGDELACLAAGLVRPRSGRVLVDGTNPFRSPSVRRRIGLLLGSETFEPHATVRSVLEGALAARGEADGADRVIAPFGLESWLGRAVDPLHPDERRTILLALALALPPPALLVLREPLTRLAGVETPYVLEALNEHVSKGSAVVCTAARARDAAQLSDRVVLLERGRIVRGPTPSAATSLVPGLALDFVVQSNAPRALARALSEHPEISGVEFDDATRPGELVVRGAEPRTLSRAILSAARESGVTVTALGTRIPGTELVRAANAGLVRAAYDGAYRVARTEGTAKASGPPEPGATNTSEGAR